MKRLRCYRYGSYSFTCRHTIIYLNLVNVPKMAPPLTRSGIRLSTTYYSFIDFTKMKGWVGLVGWPIADRLPTKWSSVSCRSSATQKKVAGDVLFLVDCVCNFDVLITFACYQHYWKMLHSYRYDTFRIDRQWLWQHAIKFPTWQHPAMRYKRDH